MTDTVVKQRGWTCSSDGETINYVKLWQGNLSESGHKQEQEYRKDFRFSQ
jgi:hypothetical protein